MASYRIAGGGHRFDPWHGLFGLDEPTVTFCSAPIYFHLAGAFAFDEDGSFGFEVRGPVSWRIGPRLLRMAIREP